MPFSGITLPILLARLLILMVALSVHEFAHAWMAVQLGDPTPRRDGRLTLNPRAHLDVLGSLMFLIAGFGWAKPVRWNPWNIRIDQRWGRLLVAASGPLSNLLLAALTAWGLQITGIIPLPRSGGIWVILPSPALLIREFIFLNVVLCFFNLLPITPLDGFEVATGLLPPSLAYHFRRLAPYGPFILLLLIILPVNLLGLILGPPVTATLRLLLG
ncbi:MAG TPA: site-2 protease family protein [Caldilineae bacterium]|nr:site-2 protease family protein [Caldilineae bacterium]